jgi:hypothetical protein
LLSSLWNWFSLALAEVKARLIFHLRCAVE